MMDYFHKSSHESQTEVLDHEILLKL